MARDLARERARVARGDALSTQEEVDALARAWKRAGSDESFRLVDPRGEPRKLCAPRWLCHLLGLRHASAHIVLVTRNGLVVLQQRASWKDTAPGRLDTAVGGHLGERTDARAVALVEMGEELGLDEPALAAPLESLGTFFVLDPDEETIDAEVVHAFLGRLVPGALDRTRFTDGEVSRLVLVPRDEAWALLRGGEEVLAAGARAVLPRALDLLERERWSDPSLGSLRPE